MIDATNRDWEDMVTASGPEAGKSYVYIGDIGDNNSAHSNYTIYRFYEPSANIKQVNEFDRIQFRYPDGSHDAEAFLVDNNTLDIYIITKRENRSRLYKLPYPQSLTEITEAEFAGEFPFGSVVSAALSSDGKEVIVKTYTQLFHYIKEVGEPIPALLTKTAKAIGYQLEPQGEAVCFAGDVSGFYTLSEEAMNITPQLFFYKKKN
jgi:hypothetical protein